MLVSLDDTRKNNTAYLRDSLILQEKILCHIGYVRMCSGLPALITASREWPLWVIVQFSVMLLRRSVQNQLIWNHPYVEMTSYLFFLPIIQYLGKYFAFSGFTCRDKKLLKEKICVGSRKRAFCRKDRAWKTESGCVGEKPKNRQVRREERMLKTAYSEMGKQTSVSIPGITAPCVVTSG